MDDYQKFKNNWEWHQHSNWLNPTDKKDTSYTGVHAHLDEHVLYGSLRYYDDPNDDQHSTFLHYRVTESTLYTNKLIMELFTRTNTKDLCEKMEQCHNAFDGFYVLLGEITNNLLDGIDTFEDSLRTLEKEMKQGRNGGKVFDEIVDHRYLLLHWSSLTIPLQETLYSAKEIFMDDIEDNKEYLRTKYRIERLITLQQYYEMEINTLLSIDDNITNYRGNEIVRALTIFTVLFTPVTALAAIWGMNFKHMPELDWRWGYVVSLIFILFSTAIVYIWLRRKGWVGDLLEGRRSK